MRLSDGSARRISTGGPHEIPPAGIALSHYCRTTSSKNPDVETYLGHLERAVALEIEALGDRGSFEAITEAKRLGYRLGLASWAGEEAASPRFLAPLIDAFERLDASDSFVRPLRTAWSGTSGLFAWAS